MTAKPERKSFEIGDIVVVTKLTHNYNSDLDPGDIGVVTDIKIGASSKYVYGIDFGRAISCGHDCSRTCKYGYGWYVRGTEIEHIHSDFNNDEIDSFL